MIAGGTSGVGGRFNISSNDFKIEKLFHVCDIFSNRYHICRGLILWAGHKTSQSGTKK